MKVLDCIMYGAMITALLYYAGYFLFVSLVTSANAGGVFDSLTGNMETVENLMTGNMETVEREAYKIDAYGYDFRIYEWHPKNAPNMTCITGFREKANIGLHCFETQK